MGIVDRTYDKLHDFKDACVDIALGMQDVNEYLISEGNKSINDYYDDIHTNNVKMEDYKNFSESLHDSNGTHTNDAITQQVSMIHQEEQASVHAESYTLNEGIFSNYISDMVLEHSLASSMEIDEPQDYDFSRIDLS